MKIEVPEVKFYIDTDIFKITLDETDDGAVLKIDCCSGNIAVLPNGLIA